MSSGSRSKLGRLALSGFNPGSVSTPGATRFTFTEFDHGCNTALIDIGDAVGGMGSLDHSIDLSRQNMTIVKPSGTFRPAVGEWATWLPWILNNTTAPAGTGPHTYTLTPQDTAVFANVHFDTDQSLATYLASGVMVSRATIRAESKAAVDLEVELEGTNFSTGVAFTATMADPVNYSTRFIMADQAVTLNSVLCKARSASIMFDNGVSNDRFFYGMTSSGPLMCDRKYYVSLTLPWGYHSSLWAAGITDGGIPCSIAFTYGTYSLTFNFATIKADAKSWRSIVPTEDFFTFNAQAFAKFSATASPAVQAVLVSP